MKEAKYEIKYHLFSYHSLMSRLVWWVWKPEIKATWTEPSGGMAGNGLWVPEASWEFRWLCLWFRVIIAPKTDEKGIRI